MPDKLPALVLKHGDNISFVESDSVDLVLTDPPFNISKKTNFATYEKNTIHSYQFDSDSGEDWDTYSHEDFLAKLNEWSAEWSRVLRKGGSFAIFCADTYTSHLMDALKRNGLSPRRVITWRKNNAVPVNRKHMAMSANEYIIVGVKNGKNVTFNSDVPILNQELDHKIVESTIVADKVSTIIYTKVKNAVLTSFPVTDSEDAHIENVAKLVEDALELAKKEAVKKVRDIFKEEPGAGKYLQACVPNYIQNPLKVGNRLHPTEKPVPVLQFLVALYSKPGDIVLDGFGGSGSTGEAALLLNRRAIIVEREKDFFDKIAGRLGKLSEDSKLF